MNSPLFTPVFIPEECKHGVFKTRLCISCVVDNIPTWISVEEKLPEFQGEYICCVKGTGIRIRTFKEWITGSRMRWWCNGQETKKVTHWMPLPKLPEIKI